MHFEGLVEDQSGKAMLDILLDKIIDKPHRFDVKAYRGIGRIPKNLKSTDDARKRQLLNQLPRLLRGHGRTFAGYEAWLLGDIPAVKAAYPRARDNLLNRYENDAICGTWELLADAVYRGGLNQLKNEGWQAIGREKSNWSKTIAPHMDVENNASPSFCYFREKVRGLAGAAG